MISTGVATSIRYGSRGADKSELSDAAVRATT